MEARIRLFFSSLKINVFSLFCTCFHALTMMLIWNWHATKYLGFKHISYVGSFIIVFFVRRLFSLRFSIEIKSIKSLLRDIKPYDEALLSETENITLLAECCLLIVVAYLLTYII